MASRFDHVRGDYLHRVRILLARINDWHHHIGFCQDFRASSKSILYNEAKEATVHESRPDLTVFTATTGFIIAL